MCEQFAIWDQLLPGKERSRLLLKGSTPFPKVLRSPIQSLCIEETEVTWSSGWQSTHLGKTVKFKERNFFHLKIFFTNTNTIQEKEEEKTTKKLFWAETHPSSFCRRWKEVFQRFGLICPCKPFQFSIVDVSQNSCWRCHCRTIRTNLLQRSNVIPSRNHFQPRPDCRGATKQKIDGEVFMSIVNCHFYAGDAASVMGCWWIILLFIVQARLHKGLPRRIPSYSHQSSSYAKTRWQSQTSSPPL